MARLAPCPSSESCSCFLSAHTWFLSLFLSVSPDPADTGTTKRSPLPFLSCPASFLANQLHRREFLRFVLFPLVGRTSSPSLPLSLRSASSLSSAPPAAFLVGQDDDTSTLHCGLERVSRRRSVESRRTTTGNSQRPQEGTYPTPSCPCLVPSCLFGRPCLARPSRHRTPEVCFRSTVDVHDKNSGLLLSRLPETVEISSPSLLYPRTIALWI